jgi:hypothetical protein
MPAPPNNRLQRTVLRAEPERSAPPIIKHVKYLLFLLTSFTLMASCAKPQVTPANDYKMREEDNIREALFSYLVRIDEEMPPQAEGSGRPWTYCLEIANEIHDNGKPPSAEFMKRFDSELRVKQKGNCNSQSERIHKIGRINWLASNRVEVWSESWASKRETGYSCLHLIEQKDGGWLVGKDCLDGLIYN